MLTRVALPLAALLTTIVLIACGGDGETSDGDGGDGTANSANGDNGAGDELSLEEYFQRIDDIFARSDEDLDALVEDLNTATGPGTDFDAAVSVLDQFVTDSIGVLSDSIDDMQAMNEPSDVRDEHEAFIAAIDEARLAIQSFQSDLEGVQNEEELEELNAEFATSFDQAVQGADTACGALQGIADDNSIIVDLNCEE
jgi:hypothetical protein